MKACAPGKLILSGEHAAVYGAPAFALAVNRYIISHCSLPVARVADAAALRWSLPDLHRHGVIDWAALPQLAARLDQRFQQFEQGGLPVGEILESPEQLLLYAIAQLLPATLPTTDLALDVYSQLPAGAGMGSSAAAAASVLSLFAAYFERPLGRTEQFALVRYCERLCHGRGGLIDAATVTHGGLIQVSDGQVEALDFPLGAGWYYVNSGSPVVGTGECVEAVRKRFATASIWQDFAALTRQLIGQIEQQQDPRMTLRDNHRLLMQIGVVPAPVARFIAQLEQLGGAGKISGAGAIRGEGGGALVVYAPDLDLAALCAAFGYSFLAIEEDSQGARNCE